MTLNYYRERGNQDWDIGLADYLNYLGLSISEIDYGCVIARKFIDRVQVIPFKTSKQVCQDLLNDLDLDG